MHTTPQSSESLSKRRNIRVKKFPQENLKKDRIFPSIQLSLDCHPFTKPSFLLHEVTNISCHMRSCFQLSLSREKGKRKRELT